jgi:hypothetical protein
VAKIDTKLTGSAGEHYVCSMLARYGWAPSLTRDGLERTDILAVHSVERWLIEVKSRLCAADVGCSDVRACCRIAPGTSGTSSSVSIRRPRPPSVSSLLAITSRLRPGVQHRHGSLLPESRRAHVTRLLTTASWRSRAAGLP